MIFGKKSCAPSDGLGFRQGQNIVHNVCGRKLGLIVQMAVDVRRGADVAVTQPFLDLLHGNIVGQPAARRSYAGDRGNGYAAGLSFPAAC